MTERRAFIQSFVKEIVVMPGDALLRYTVPMPDDSLIPGRTAEKVTLPGSVLPTLPDGGPTPSPESRSWFPSSSRLRLRAVLGPTFTPRTTRCRARHRRMPVKGSTAPMPERLSLHARRTRTYSSTLYILYTFHRVTLNSMEGGGWYGFITPHQRRHPPRRSTIAPPFTPGGGPGPDRLPAGDCFCEKPAQPPADP